MKILAILTPKPDKAMAEFQKLIVAEEKAVWAAYKSGTIREMYFQPDPLVVSIIYEAPGHAEVNALIDSFPMIQAGLLDRRLITLGPWLPLEALFADASHA